MRRRKTRKGWGDRWEAYNEKWEALAKGGPSKISIASIPWPVESGQRKDVEAKAI